MILDKWRHRSPRFFLKSSETRVLMARVAAFERQTGCELVFHFRKTLGPAPLKANEELFKKFKLDRTQNRNVILITLALGERQFAVWADEGVHRHTGDKLWTDICLAMAMHLKQGQHLEALIQAIKMAEEVLKKEQPRRPDQKAHEISNRPIIGDER